MAKRRGKALKGKEQPSSNPISKKVFKKKSTRRKKKSKKTDVTSNPKVGHSSSNQMVVNAPTHASISTSVALGSDRGKQKAKEGLRRGCGFIFMCNAKTKPQCFQYRVFGLPKGKIEVVKNINHGMKLFLFDTDLKLLYGIYQATTKGALDIEPMAFNGQFQAQVKFDIFKDCLPLPESAFKHAIKDNYERGPKFRQELSSKQVKNLISLFRPISKPPSTHNVHLRPNVDIRESFVPTRTEEVAKSYPLENSSSRLHYLPLYGTGSQHAVQHEEYNPFEPATHVPYSQVERRPAGIDAPPRQFEPRYLELVHEPYFPGNPLIPSQDTYGSFHRNEKNHEDSRFGYESKSSTLQLVADRENVAHTAYTPTGYYSQRLSPRTSLTVPLSQAGFSEPPRHTLSSLYQSRYSAVPATALDPSSRVYGVGTPQRPSYGYMDANLSITSHYSSTGARFSYR